MLVNSFVCCVLGWQITELFFSFFSILLLDWKEMMEEIQYIAKKETITDAHLYQLVKMLLNYFLWFINQP